MSEAVAVVPETDPVEPRYRALALDDDRRILRFLKRMLESRGIETMTCVSGMEALSAVRSASEPFDVMLCDVAMPDMSGIDVLRQVRTAAPELPVVMLTGDQTAETAVQALRAGAFNYLTKPLSDVDEILEILGRAASYGQLQRHARDLERRVDISDRFDRIVGSCAPMRRLLDAVERVARLDVSVLVLGESGTGKELIARALHDKSSRASGPFVALNCAAVPETLVDSELFGHARGAFTGAVEARAGAFERADGGTLFLDEIGDIPPAVQVRLLRVLQEGEVTRVGEGAPRSIDVRVVGATWVDLDEAVGRGKFRPDLFYRLSVVNLEVPPLRNRTEDLPILIAHLVHKHVNRMGRSEASFSRQAVEALCAYPWPGNVRELENAIQRALALGRGDLLTEELLPPKVLASIRADGGVASAIEWSWADGISLAQARKLANERFERGYLTRLLRSTGGNISEAGRRAKIDRSNLRRILSRVGIEVSDFKG